MLTARKVPIMNEFILFGVLILGVMYVAYRRLRGHIKSLGDEITGQRSGITKLRDANSELRAELKRIECRLNSREPESSPSSAPDSDAKDTPTSRPLSHEAVTPPPLPPSTVETAREPSRVPKVERSGPAWENATPAETPVPAAQSNVPGAVEPSVFSRIPWQDVLEKLHLLPPGKSESGETAESQLAAWWVIRIGLVLLIIAAVFFGIYVSQHTPAWLRVLTLALVSVGTIGLGARMKDKLEGFGRAIIGGGFALLYFTAFSAFALPATKVIDSPALGVMAQFAALVVAIAWSLWKKDQTVATLTLFLGFVSCGFSHSHDLDRFAMLGLVLLAATGSFLFATRGWLTPFITSLAGSWIGFGTFALLDWSRGDAPAFLYLTGTLVALTVLFESGSFVCVARGVHPPGDRLRRWLTLGNTSAAAVLGYAVTRLIYPEQLSTFYFIFAGLYFAFTGIHHLRTTDRAVTESLFLKSSALLCLGFAASFTGPVRWLAIAFQAFALLWTARRSGSRWIAVGFALVLAASVGWFWRDLIVDTPADWRWLDSFRIAGALYLVFLTAQLGFHSLWFPTGIGGANEDHHKQARGFRVAGAFVIGLSALALALNPAFPGRSDPVWFLFLLSIGMGLVSPLMRRSIPCVAAALPLLSSYIAYAALPARSSQGWAALSLGIVLIVAAFGIAEAIRRFWPDTIRGGSSARSFSLLAGLAMLLPFSHALCGMHSLSGSAGIGVFVLFPVIACAAILSRKQTTVGGLETGPLTAFQVAVGLLVLIGGSVTCESSRFFPSVLVLSGLPLLALAMRIGLRHVAVAGAIPILSGFYVFWERLLVGKGTLATDSINLVMLLVVSVGLAVIFWKKDTLPRWKQSALWCDVALHSMGVISLHLYFQNHLGEGPDIFAAALLGGVLFAVSRRFTFRTLGFVSWLPLALACYSSVVAVNWLGCGSGEVWFWGAGLLVLVHLVTADHFGMKENGSDVDAITMGFGLAFPKVMSFIAVLAWTLIASAVTENPWRAAALTGVALLCSSLWRWRKIALIGYLGLGPVSVAVCVAATVMFMGDTVRGPVWWTLMSVLITAVGLATNGVIMANAVRHVLERKITPTSVLPWFHAGIALLIAFSAFAIDRLVSENLTAVFWGLSAIVLFVSGLFAGLRAYRLTGLVGLIFCTGHIFIWDIQDTFYRIIAFFVIGLVMLAIGFLYHRFRERISALDS